MHKLYVDLDELVFERVFEPLAHWLEAHTGINNFTLARYALAPWAAAIVQDAIVKPSPTAITLATLAALCSGLAWWQVTQLEREARCAGTASYARHSRYFTFCRYLFLGLSVGQILFVVLPLDVTQLHRAIREFSFLCHLYFMACAPMPPSYRETVKTPHGQPVPQGADSA